MNHSKESFIALLLQLIEHRAVCLVIQWANMGFTIQYRTEGREPGPSASLVTEPVTISIKELPERLRRHMEKRDPLVCFLVDGWCEVSIVYPFEKFPVGRPPASEEAN